ncbi:MAG: phosphonate ABC transporter ATP-binding protein [Burkholderiales bacterium]|jgi:phosphonate transport system ATP-binding protein|nr:phosphonate ABC transporter ATP-binding protein [Burkholderiales bacterium]
MSRPLFEVRGAGKSFAGVAAMSDVSFAVRRGEFVAVLGPSGAGKTTLFRCLAGLSSLDTGTAHLDGVDVATLHGRARRRIAFVFQQFNLVNRLSALHNVLAGRLGHVSAWRGWTRQFSRADTLLALECLDRVGLLAQAAQRADTLSGGQQQRVAIARALAQQPELIIADEPVASLDPRIGADILELLRSICHAEQGGVAMICSLHQPQFAKRFADRVVGLAGGRIVLDTPATEFAETSLLNVYGRAADSEDPRPSATLSWAAA